MGDVSLGIKSMQAVRLWITKWNLRVTSEQYCVTSKPGEKMRIRMLLIVLVTVALFLLLHLN